MGNLVCQYCRQDQNLNKFSVDNQIIIEKEIKPDYSKAGDPLNDRNTISKDFRGLTEENLITHTVLQSNLTNHTNGDETRRIPMTEEEKKEFQEEFSAFNKNYKELKDNFGKVNKLISTDSFENGKIIRETISEVEISEGRLTIEDVVKDQIDKSIKLINDKMKGNIKKNDAKYSAENMENERNKNEEGNKDDANVDEVEIEFKNKTKAGNVRFGEDIVYDVEAIKKDYYAGSEHHENIVSISNGLNVNGGDIKNEEQEDATSRSRSKRSIEEEEERNSVIMVDASKRADKNEKKEKKAKKKSKGEQEKEKDSVKNISSIPSPVLELKQEDDDLNDNHQMLKSQAIEVKGSTISESSLKEKISADKLNDSQSSAKKLPNLVKPPSKNTSKANKLESVSSIKSDNGEGAQTDRTEKKNNITVNSKSTKDLDKTIKSVPKAEPVGNNEKIGKDKQKISPKSTKNLKNINKTELDKSTSEIKEVNDEKVKKTAKDTKTEVTKKKSTKKTLEKVETKKDKDNNSGNPKDLKTKEAKNENSKAEIAGKEKLAKDQNSVEQASVTPKGDSKDEKQERKTKKKSTKIAKDTKVAVSSEKKENNSLQKVKDDSEQQNSTTRSKVEEKDEGTTLELPVILIPEIEANNKTNNCPDEDNKKNLNVVKKKLKIDIPEDINTQFNNDIDAYDSLKKNDEEDEEGVGSKSTKRKHQFPEFSARRESRLDKENEFALEKKDLIEKISFEIQLTNLNEKRHDEVEFMIEVQFTNSETFDDNDFFTIGTTGKYVMDNTLSITFPETFEVNFLFERTQITKINIYSSDGKKSEVSINIAKIITNKLQPISICVDLLKTQVIEYCPTKSKNELVSGTSQQIKPQILNINFRRTTRHLDMKLYTFFVEFFYLHASQVANRLKYKILTENFEGKVKELYTSNELMGKSPLVFAATNFLDSRFLVDEDTKCYVFEFYEGERYFGQTVLYRNDLDQILGSRDPAIYNVFDQPSIIPENNNKRIKAKNKSSINLPVPKPHISNNQLKIDPKLSAFNNKSSSKALTKSFKEGKQQLSSRILSPNESGRQSPATFSPRNTSIGKIIINFRERKKKKFLDFVLEGMNVTFETAIDYTSSNLDPQDPKSLHTLQLENNKYSKAIKSCGNILELYDSYHMFPVYGFGGVPYKGKEVSHCFNINFKKDPRISGLEEVLLYYEQSLKFVEMVGPTYFQYVIKNSVDLIKKEIKTNSLVYHVLLILTDGKIEDMNETKHILVEASKLPLSIIIVGIGKADFGKMNELDGDDIPISSPFTGELRYRDIVQFVNFSDYENDGKKLAAKVLEEIPDQVAEYFEMMSEK